MMETGRWTANLLKDDIAHRCGAGPTFIDLLPIELLEWVIYLGATHILDIGPDHTRLYTWRRVSRKWASAIDGCPTLWSNINIEDGIENLENRLAKSKTSPLDITVFPPPSSEHNTEWLRLLVDHAHRWRSVFPSDEYFGEMMAILDSSPPMLETLSLSSTIIPSDCKFFSPGSTHLRKLVLNLVTLPENFDPPFKLEELYLSDIKIWKPTEPGVHWPISRRMVHQFLQASPELRSLILGGSCAWETGDEELPPIDLPKLQNVQIPHTSCSSIINLLRAENCAQVDFYLVSGYERPPLMAWATLANALKRAEELEILVRDTSLRIWSKPNTVRLAFEFVAEEYGDSKRLTYSVLEDILNEAERDSPLSAGIELVLLTSYQPNSDFDVALEVLKLLQTPTSEPSSGLTRWRLPHLDTLRINDDEGRPYQPLQGFVQARSNRGDSSQASRAITIICGPWDQVVFKDFDSVSEEPDE